MAIVLVQSTFIGQAGSPRSKAFTSNVTAGNFLLICYFTDTSGAATITTSKSDVVAQAGSDTLIFISGQGFGRIYYVKSAVGGATTIIGTQSGAFPGLVISEWSGIDPTAPLDQVGSMGSGSSTAVLSGSITTTSANELLVGIAMDAAGGLTYTPGSGYTNLAAFSQFQPEYQIVSSTGAYTAGATLSSSAVWSSALVSFKAATGGGGGRALVTPSGLDGLSTSGPKQFNPSLGYHRQPTISLEAYRREQSRRHREFLAQVRAA